MYMRFTGNTALALLVVLITLMGCFIGVAVSAGEFVGIGITVIGVATAMITAAIDEETQNDQVTYRFVFSYRYIPSIMPHNVLLCCFP